MFEYHPMTKQAKSLSGSKKKQFGFYAKVDRPCNTASYWSDGSRDYYSVVNMLTGATGTPPCGQYPMFKAEYQLKPQELLINTSIFAGKPGTARFECRPEDEALARKFLGIEAIAVMAA